jgi:hypothetical protein
MSECKHRGCERDIYVMGMCRKHYDGMVRGQRYRLRVPQPLPDYLEDRAQEFAAQLMSEGWLEHHALRRARDAYRNQ